MSTSAAAPNIKLQPLVDQLDKESGSGCANWLWQCEDAFRVFLESAREIAVEELNRALTSIVREPGHQSRSWDLQQISLLESDKYILGCSLFIEPMDCLYSSSFQALVGVLGPGPLTCVRYRLPALHDRDVLNVAEELVYDRTCSIEPGRYVALRGEQDVLDFFSAAPTILVRLFSPANDVLHHCYDRLTRRPWMVQAGDPASTQLVCLINALAHFADPTSLGAFEAVSGHPHHFVRWAAIRAMAAISRERALSLVHEALKDDHPDVRSAAQRTLAKVT
jgi:HEAT repeats